MKFVVSSLLLMFALTTVTFAKDAPNAEVFGGWEFSRNSDVNMFKGWAANVTGNITDHFGIMGDFSQSFGGGHFRFVDIGGNQFNFQAGPKFTLVNGKPVKPFLYILFGGARASAGINVMGIDVSAAATAYSASAGGGLDVSVNRRLSIRAFQADYNPTYSNTSGQVVHGLRLATGLVFKF